MSVPDDVPRWQTAEEAVRPIRSGEHVLIGSGAAEPQQLVEALTARHAELFDVELMHLLTLGKAPYADPSLAQSFRHNALFIGPNVRDAVGRGMADYTPCFLFEIPGLLRSGRLPLDAALVQVSPPEDGVCSLGVSVDILKAAVDAAHYVVAQVNPRMPRTCGDSTIRVQDIDAFVLHEGPLFELPQKETLAEALFIGRYVAQLVENGSTLQLGIGAIPDAVLAALAHKKDLGIHSEMISDGVLALMEKGVITGRKKTLFPGKVVASFAMGSSRLYAAVDRNPAFHFSPSDYVNDPMVISRNDNMVSINSALQIDLTGQVAADSIGARLYSGFGGQVDFIRGASRSKGGRSIIALPSTAKSHSRIVPMLSAGSGVVTSRADVDFVVTEHGIASLKGKTIRERAIALIQIAHPSHRAALIEAAKKIGYLDAGRVIPLEGDYRSDLEARVTFGDLSVFLRPLRSADERRLKDLFYWQSARTTYLRFGIPLKRLSEEQFQNFVAIDYRTSLAIGAFVRSNGRERLIAVARYYAPPGDSIAEAAFTVQDAYQGRGLGTFLVDYLAWIAQQQGLKGFTAQILTVNDRMRHVFERAFKKTKWTGDRDAWTAVALFADRRNAGNPAAAKAKAAAGAG